MKRLLMIGILFSLPVCGLFAQAFNQSFHKELPKLLEKKGVPVGAVSQADEAIRIATNNAGGHFIPVKMMRSEGGDEEGAKKRQIGITRKPNNPSKRICAGCQLSSPKVIHQVRPIYPAEAKTAGTEGMVRIEAVVDRDGKVKEVKLLSGHPVLAKAAMEAVSKWQYRPTVLNGTSVEVECEIDVNFRLSKK
jgi:TonB family protein